MAKEIMKITVRKFLTQNEKNPVPMRTMFGTIEKETAKSVYVKMEGKPQPSSYCLHCHRPLHHKISVILGIGPVCSGLNYNVNLPEEEIDSIYGDIQARMASMKFTGWLPKRHIQMEGTGEFEEELQEEKIDTFDILFKWNNKTYHVVTHKKDKIEEIQCNADEIIRMELVG